MKLAQKNAGGNRTKHVDIKYHIVAGHLSVRHRNVKYCSTSEITVDSLTELLPTILCQRHRNYCGPNQARKQVILPTADKGGVLELTGAARLLLEINYSLFNAHDWIWEVIYNVSNLFDINL